MATAIPATEKLAVHGGTPVCNSPINPPAWPPVDDTTAQGLVEIYRRRKWSFAGPTELAFQADFAKAHDAAHGVFMANGTVTLQGALAVHGIGPGDEVIIPALTWPATAMAPLYLGATPVFVDIEPDTFCIDPEKFRQAITPRTRAVIPVHIYGSMANLDQVMTVAREHGLIVIEDCAHGHGGKWDGKGLGSFGDVGSFSFQESKTMASGEGGICLTNSAEMAERLYRFKHIGYAPGSLQGKAAAGPPAGLMCHNFRGTEFQACILDGQLKSLDRLIDTYNRNARILEQELAGVPNIQVQARGRKSTRQNYYAWAVKFTPADRKGLTLQSILAALGAEGLRMGGTYGVVYKHVLWNARPEEFRVQDGSCQVAENDVCAWTAVFLHSYLGSDEPTIRRMAGVIAKVATQIDSLRAV